MEAQKLNGIELTILNIGKLKVPTGELIVCDPLVYYNSKPFLRKVKPGIYPIRIFVAKTIEYGDRYALAQLQFNQKKACKWVMALREGEDIIELTEPNDYFGFPVDAGLGGFMDSQSAKGYENFIDKFLKKYPDGNIYDDFFAAEFKKNAENHNDPQDFGNWINFQVPESELNITMFQSGFGDGVYLVYWGIDNAGNITSLIIDFLVLDIE